MLLGVAQRIHLLAILPPAEGDAYFLRAVRRLRRALSFSDQETSAWRVERGAGGLTTWDVALAQAVEVDLSGKAGDYVAMMLQKASELGRLSEDLIEVYDTFYPPEEDNQPCATT